MANPNSQFQIVVDRPLFYQKANFYKVKELLIEDDAPPTKFVKTHPGILFKHELEVQRTHRVDHTESD